MIFWQYFVSLKKKRGGANKTDLGEINKLASCWLTDPSFPLVFSAGQTTYIFQYSIFQLD